MLKSVEIENWRCIEAIELPLAPLTALVGPNGVGKSAVLKALEFTLGSHWPALSYLDIPRDFHKLDPSRSLRICCEFDPPLAHVDAMGTSRPVPFLEYSCRPYKRKVAGKEVGDLHDDFYPLSAARDRPNVATSPPLKGKPPTFGPLLRVSPGLRDQARILSISDRRSVASHASGRRGSVLNMLLDAVRKDFSKDAGGTRSDFGERYAEALQALRTEAVKEIEASISGTAKQMLGFLGSRSLAKLEISFGFGDPANPFGSLTVMCTEGDLTLPAETMGLGIQSAIVVGVFEALRHQQGNIGTVVIEEPEMYLHPQAQRFFHQLLLDLVGDGRCQVIYSSHSPIFADMTNFRGLRLLRKDAETTTVSRISQPTDENYLEDQLKRQKLNQYMSPGASEALFARAALLVEGHGDYLAACRVAEKLGIELDAEGLSIVTCGGKRVIPFFARVCRALGIPVIVMHDEDVHDALPGRELQQWQVEENARAPADNSEIREALGDDPEVYVLRPSLEAELGIGRNASDKPMKVADAVDLLDLADTPEGLLAAVKALGACA